MNHCKKVLGDDDFAYIMKYESPTMMMAEMEKLIATTRNSSVPRFLRQLKPHLLQVNTFVLGVLRAEKSDELLSLITQMWSDIAINLTIFEVYKEHIAEDQSLGLILFEVLEELQKFAVFTTKTLEHVRRGTYDPGEQVSTCKTEFENTSQFISHRIQVVKEKVQAQQLTRGQQIQRAEAIDLIIQNQLSRTSTMLTPASEGPLFSDEAQLPVYYLPLPRNPVFYGRDHILQLMDGELKSPSTTAVMASAALWAPAGMGKTQVALEYAYRCREDGVQAILWIDTEHESEWAKAFTEIANLLGLAGATSSKGHDANRLLVLRWLQETQTPWLIVFDNVENQQDLTRLWPISGPGRIIITCRSELTAASCSRLTIEVPAFSAIEGGTLLRRELRIAEDTEENVKLSTELSALLGGHAITLNVMARSIMARKKSLPDFVQMYKSDPRSLHRKPKRRTHNLNNQYYNKSDDLESIWTIPFGEVEEDEAKIFGIMSMLGSSKIPSALFNLRTVGFGQNDVEEIMLGLRSLALIGVSQDGSLYSVHRLIQGEYRAYIGIEGQLIRWSDAVRALREAFPKQHKGSTMFNQWRLCESLIEHVESLAARYRDLSGCTDIPYTEDFSYLMSDASRYLVEIGRYNACVTLLGHGFDHCKDKESTVFTNLSTIMGQAYCERGQDLEALKHKRAVLRIREAQLHPNHSEIANALSNLALSMVGCGKDVEGALLMLQRSLEIDLANPREDHTKVIHLRHLNTAFALRALGRFKEAAHHVAEANRSIMAEFGMNSRSFRVLADLAIQEGDLDTAFQYAEEALRIARLADTTSPWAAAALYYMGDIKIRQGHTAMAM
ncbi:hypothetical protein F5Y16DRAFT_419650 [Xylariaceae sp. FL0255]|nr:hypothetical protein F5Y16DRAFT_419650 [Xylariaceae sp. FL0255]